MVGDNLLNDCCDQIPRKATNRSSSFRRVSYPVPSQAHIKQEEMPCDFVDPVLVAVMAAGDEKIGARRASLNCNIEYALAMVNDSPALHEYGYDDEERQMMCPFGTRRDSVCGGPSKLQQVSSSKTQPERRRKMRKNLKKRSDPERQEIEQQQIATKIYIQDEKS